MDTLYLILFLVIILAGSVLSYVYYLKEKKSELASIKRGFCPKCHQKSIELADQRSTGCSGPKILTFTCTQCGYTNTFSVHGSDCGI
ncbi:MAG TPA: hypothetical protein CFH81_07205 [Sulfurovum sp. UBA12169]|nr:MAG TPA: hypothetical protein CFH81_07205 [Sulfurovum sp. UBA12169]